MSYLGVDIGTTGCKAVGLLMLKGKQLVSALSRVSHPWRRKPGWARAGFAEVCTACMEAIRQAAVASRLAGATD